MAHLRRLQAAVALSLQKEVHSPIVPIIFGDAGRAVRTADVLLAEGYHVPAIRPPTVAEGSSRLRLTLSAEHQLQDVMNMLNILVRGKTYSKL